MTISNWDDLIFCNVSTLVQALKTNQRLHRKTLPYTVKNRPSPSWKAFEINTKSSRDIIINIMPFPLFP